MANNEILLLKSKIKNMVAQVAKICGCQIKFNYNIEKYFKTTEDWSLFFQKLNSSFSTSFDMTQRHAWKTLEDVVTDITKSKQA